MKGEVEIVRIIEGREETVLKESNLVMDGFGESIVTIMTTPSGIIADGVRGSAGDLSNRLDTSNYIIQGIAFAKGTQGYLNNNHRFKNVNGVKYSEDMTEFLSWEPFQLTVQEASGITAPDISSNVFILEATSISIVKEGRSLCQDLAYDGKQTDGMDDKIAFSVDLKYRPELPQYEVGGGRYSTISVNQNGDDSYLVIKWDASGNATILDPSVDTSVDGKFTRGFMKNLGNGWYRLCVVPKKNLGAGTTARVRIYPSLSYETTSIGFSPSQVRDSLGSVYASRPMAAIANFPTDYVPTYVEDVLDGNLDLSVTTSYSGLIYGVNTVGTLYTDTSAYHGVVNAPEMPNPVNRELEPHTTYYPELISDLVVYGYHNKNFNSFSSIAVSSYLRGWEAGLGASGITSDNMSFYLGCYAPTSGITIAVVDDDYTIQASATNLSGHYAAIRSMDKDGYVRAFYPTIGDTSDASGRLIVSANSDFSSTGELSCITIIPKADAAVANMYGGIFEAGLFNLDLETTLRESGIQPPYDKDVDTGDQFYMKLISRKTFNDNIVVSRDKGSDGGVINHDGVKLIWRLNFL